jgi:hypothetical protein
MIKDDGAASREQRRARMKFRMAKAGVNGRDAAIEKCTAESRMPRGKYYDWDGVWDARYRSCMSDLGYRE